MRVRAAAFAGSWYPSSPDQCRRQIEGYFQDAPEPPQEASEPLGGIVPHAGWTFSGHLAGKVLALLKGGQPPATVILIGGHSGPWDTHTLMAEGAWETPFGPIEVDAEMAAILAGEFTFHIEAPERGEPDNTREVQLPLIAYSFPGARILPIAPAATSEAIRIGERCGAIAQEMGLQVRVLGSTDLTHYGPGYGYTPQGRGRDAERWVREVQDPRVINQMRSMEPNGVLDEALTHRNACCPGATAAAVACMKTLGARISQLVGYATSSDVMPGEDFVGYVGMVFWS